jgi:hypothetical protein
VIPSGPRGLIYQALLYETADQFLSSAVPFVSEGLHRGDSVIAVTSDANAELLRQNLNGGGDSVTFIEASRWYDAPSRTLAAYHRLVDRLQQESLRVIGEPVWVGLDALETSEWGRYESMVNVSLAAAPAWMMCGYDPPVVASHGPGRRHAHPPRAGRRRRERAERDVCRPRHVLRRARRRPCRAPIRGRRAADDLRRPRPDARICRQPRADNGGSGCAPRRLHPRHQWCDLLQIHTGRPDTTVRMHIRRV